MEVITGERKNMKLRILNITIWNLFVFLILNCSIGTQRDTCRYNLHQSISSGYCKFIGTGTASTNPNMDVNTLQKRDQILTFELLNCLDYYERLKECDKEENRYIPSIYGFNMKKFSTKKSSVIAVR
ncbi:hypothetical protein Lepto1489_23465 (plasmid) [Leptospira interrogans serovar Bataviae]|uniref:Uncharacterized protein n=2 Tax=Leptospira interrogans TaxID=173 RepID=A0AAP9WRI7_LEPIR|nr:hypothetical protein Lepto1489_23465 [Leptospira interrogans serovar Bataviae]